MNQIQEVDDQKTALSSFSNNFHPLNEQKEDGLTTNNTGVGYTLVKQRNFNGRQGNNSNGLDNHHSNFNGYHVDYQHPHSHHQNYSSFYSSNQYDYYDPLLARRYNYINDKFPRAEYYKSDISISKAFPHLKNINDVNFSVENVSPDAKFFFMRSSNDDNIHKAIKYETWTSTMPCNQKLEKAYTDYLEAHPNQEPEIYLVYSVVKTRNLLGVAKMTSHFNPEDSFKYWLESNKYKGTFSLKWIFIKDVSFAKIEDCQNDRFSVKNLKDGDEIPFEVGTSILSAFAKNETRPNIFDIFEYMDRREDVLRHTRDNEIMIHPARKAGEFFNGKKYGSFGGRTHHYNNYHNGYRNGFKYNNYGNNDSRINGNNSTNTNTNNDFKNGAAANSSSSYQNDAKNDGVNGFKRNNNIIRSSTNNDETNNAKPQDVASVFFVRNPDQKANKDKKKNKGASKKKVNGSNQDKIEEDFWNNKPKLTNQNIPESDDEEEDQPQINH